MRRNKKRSGASEGARRATGEAPDALGRGGRFSAKRKVAAIVRLLRGEELDAVSRELGVTAATLSAWRDDFLVGAEANLKARQPTPQDDEILHLKAKIGDLTMRNELLLERARALEANLPLALRRSRR